MNAPKDRINLSVQDTLRLIVKMINEGHTATPIKLAPVFLTQAAERIDQLEAELALHQPDREMHD